jgi:hypothetical protein
VSREKKKPKAREAPALKATSAQKKPRIESTLENVAGLKPVWRVGRADFRHELWGLSRAEPGEVTAVLQFLSEMETLTWGEIWQQQTGGDRRRGPKHKYVPMDHLCGEAQSSLSELQLDDASDDWFRFRLGNMRRLWGIIEGRIFYPVWWDPRHEVCPSQDQ